jgi:cephalosporin hydroxylase
MTAGFVNTMQLGAMDYRYKGRPALKCPMDLAIYAELLQELRPRSIIEFGSHKGGSAVWLADQVAAFGLDAMIYSFDIQPPTDAPYPGVEFRFCDTARIRDSIDDAFMRALPRPLLLIDDASHIYGHVLNTMEFFHDHAVPGDYMVVEDGMISIAEAEDLHGYEGGPFQAIHTFLKEHPGLYEIDRARCDRFGLNVTWNPDGYIRRIA